MRPTPPTADLVHLTKLCDTLKRVCEALQQLSLAMRDEQTHGDADPKTISVLKWKSFAEARSAMQVEYLTAANQAQTLIYSAAHWLTATAEKYEQLSPGRWTKELIDLLPVSPETYLQWTIQHVDGQEQVIRERLALLIQFRQFESALDAAAPTAQNSGTQLKANMSLHADKHRVPLSLLDLPAILNAIKDLFRVIENPTERNPVAADVFRRWTARTTTGEQSLDGVVPSAFIDAAVKEVMSMFGQHNFTECPEITDSKLDLITKAALLELRAELIKPLAPHFWATHSSTQTQFLAYLERIIRQLDNEPSLRQACVIPTKTGNASQCADIQDDKEVQLVKPVSGLLNPFDYDEPCEQFRTALKGWYPEWRDARAALEDALLPVVNLYQTAATAIVPDKQVSLWRVAGDALQTSELADFPRNMLDNRGIHPGQTPTTELKIVFAVWAMATAAVENDSDALSLYSNKIAMLYATKPDAVRDAVRKTRDEIVMSWMLQAGPRFVARVKAEADHLGLTPEVVDGMSQLSNNHKELTAYKLWLSGWRRGIFMVSIDECEAKSEGTIPNERMLWQLNDDPKVIAKLALSVERFQEQLAPRIQAIRQMAQRIGMRSSFPSIPHGAPTDIGNPTTTTKPHRDPITQEQRETLIANAIKKRMKGAGNDMAKRIVFAAAFTINDIVIDTSIPRSTVGDTKAWKAHAAKYPKQGRKQTKPHLPGQLTSTILATRPDHTARTPLDQLADIEEIEAKYRAACSPAELAKLDAMTPAERREMFDLFADQLEDAN